MYTTRMADSAPEVNGNYQRSTAEIQEQVKEPLSFYDADDRTREKINYALIDHGILTQIENTLLTETGFNHDNRTIVSALVGVGKNTIDWEKRDVKWFAAGKASIAKELCEYYPEMKDNYPQSNKDRAAYYLDRLFKDQNSKGINWIEMRLMPFNKQTRTNPPSQYRLIFQKYVAEAYYRAYSNPMPYTNDDPGTKWEKAAREVAEEWKEDLKKEKPKRSRTKKSQSAEDAKKAAKGMLLRYATMEVNKRGLETTEAELLSVVADVMSRVARERDTAPTIDHLSEVDEG